jgi:hypothetical protein
VIGWQMPSWLLVLSVIIVAAVALTWASSPPTTAFGRRAWIASLIAFGSAAVAATVVQQQRAIDQPIGLVGSAAAPPRPQAGINDATSADLIARVKTLEARLRESQRGSQFREINEDTAEKFAAYLKQFGPRRVVVSCIPDDYEAYQYANRVLNVLKAADWDAQGPEPTKIFGDVRGAGVNLYVSPDDHSDTAKVLLDGFAKFNIPYQSRVTPSQAIPGSETVELFVGTKRADTTSAGADKG